VRYSENDVCLGYGPAGSPNLHDWRLIEEEAIYEHVDPGGIYPVGHQPKFLSYKRKWYCTRCRWVQTTRTEDEP
jgi:hypothetical protein